MSRVYCNKSLLKFEILEATRLKSESNRNPKLFCPWVEVCVQDDTGKRVDHCEFKTKRVSYIDKNATWNTPAMFAFNPGATMKVVFHVKDDSDSLGECSIPVSSLFVIVDQQPQWYDLHNSGRIHVLLGWYGPRDPRLTGGGIDVPLTSRAPVFKKKMQLRHLRVPSIYLRLTAKVRCPFQTQTVRLPKRIGLIRCVIAVDVRPSLWTRDHRCINLTSIR